MARTAVVAALLMGIVAAHAAACPKAISGYSGFFGAPLKKSTDRYVNQIPKWGSHGDMTAVEMFYRDGCITGVRPTYGPSDAYLMGTEDGTGKKITLDAGETIVEVDYKGGKRCVEYLSFTTSQGRVLSLGNVASPTVMSRATANRAGAYLGAFRGWINAEKSLEQLQAVWGIYKCADSSIPAPVAPGVQGPAGDAANTGNVRPVNSIVPPLKPPTGGAAPDAAAPMPEQETVLAEPEPIPMEVIEADDPSMSASNDAAAVQSEAAPATSEAGPAPPADGAAAAAPSADATDAAAAAPAAAEAQATAAAPAETPISLPAPSPAAAVTAKPVCAPRPDLCDAKAASGSANSCRAVSPFETSSCIGGCCISSGRCKSGSCAANGLGKEASLTCFGQNKMPNPLALMGNRCGQLACKLAVPGCKTALIGGTCVGVVVATGDVSKLHPMGAKYVGYPCIEAGLPSGGIVNTPALISWSLREYVEGAWKVCDCAEQAPAPSSGLRLPKLFGAVSMPSLTNAFGLGSKNTTGDASLAPSTFTAMKDLMFASLNREDKNKDPFAEFTTDSASPSQTDDAAGQSGEVKAASVDEVLPMDVMEATDVEAAEAAGNSPSKATLVIKPDGSARVVSVEKPRPAPAKKPVSVQVRAASTSAAAPRTSAKAPRVVPIAARAAGTTKAASVNADVDATVGVYGPEGPPPPEAAAVGEPVVEEDEESTYTPADASGEEVKPAPVRSAAVDDAAAEEEAAAAVAAAREQRKQQLQAQQQRQQAQRQRQEEERLKQQQLKEERLRQQQLQEQEEQQRQQEEQQKQQQAVEVDRSTLSLDDPGPPPPEAAAVGEPYNEEEENPEASA